MINRVKIRNIFYSFTKQLTVTKSERHQNSNSTTHVEFRKEVLYKGLTGSNEILSRESSGNFSDKKI